ncbi:efflux transporter outer membrane subunit [uncultured Castellaniella sp.]|uniref:efflux transporter outer membrane subunit n=1 Tax=uncultured Castellaniella sp. TaxID=647907 RepID=UPI0026394634|nr:efflux transporter outer membrane subunit [uncultured Castellaniella sp.]
MRRHTSSRRIRHGASGPAAGMACGRFPLLRILGAAGMLALSACVNLAPATRLPAPPVADAWPADAETAPAPATTRAWRDLDWANYFQDADMRRLISLALEHNRDLRLAGLRVREAEAAHRIQRADLSPSISIQGGVERSRVPGDLNPAGQPQIQSRSQVGIGLTHWEIDLWGRIRNLKDAALDDWLASDAARQAVRVALVRQVADSVLVLRELDQRAFLADEAVRNRRQSLEIFQRRKGAGSSSELELTQVRTLLIQAESLRVQLQQERAAAAHALTLLTGVANAGIAPAEAIDLESMRLTRLEPGLPSEVLLSRPDIRAAEYQLRSAHARIGAARAAFLPRIALTSSTGSASAELDGLFGGGSRAWTFAPVIELPIFTAGRLRTTLDVTEVRRDMAVATYEKNIQTAFREVADALSARQGLAEQMDIQARMARTQAARAELAQLRYDSGAAPYLEVLDAQRDLLTAQQQLVQVRRAWLSSQVALYAALGGGAGPALPNSPALQAT